MSKHYIGRFAPSPTGKLHFGSLVTAVASYFQARQQNGLWFVRMEDIDPAREVSGAQASIIETLQAHHLQWDGKILFQSRRQAAYLQALALLSATGRVYRCQCSRRMIKMSQQNRSLATSIYPGTCRNKNISANKQHSLRIRVENCHIEFSDVIQGLQKINLFTNIGDFVIHRANRQVAYQLAVVVDDIAQNITQVVRGCDLLESSFKQIYLTNKLGHASHQYLHLPIVTNKKGEKLSKQTAAKPLSLSNSPAQLWHALNFLGQQPPLALQYATTEALHHWALQAWNVSKIPKLTEVYYEF